MPTLLKASTLKAHGISTGNIFCAFFLVKISLSLTSSACSGHGGHKTSTLEKKEKNGRENIVLNSCFQWLIKEMKCIMMVMPLHVSLLPRSLMVFSVLCHSCEFFIFTFQVERSRRKSQMKEMISGVVQYSQHCCDSKK